MPSTCVICPQHVQNSVLSILPNQCNCSGSCEITESATGTNTMGGTTISTTAGEGYTPSPLNAGKRDHTMSILTIMLIVGVFMLLLVILLVIIIIMRKRKGDFTRLGDKSISSNNNQNEGTALLSPTSFRHIDSESAVVEYKDFNVDTANVLGVGASGAVLKGTLWSTDVAIKILSAEENTEDFLEEAKFLL